jgi:hypothetical protein
MRKVLFFGKTFPEPPVNGFAAHLSNGLQHQGELLLGETFKESNTSKLYPIHPLGKGLGSGLVLIGIHSLAVHHNRLFRQCDVEVHVVLQDCVDGLLELPGSAEDGLAVGWVEFHLTDGVQQGTNNFWDLVYGAAIQGI